MKAKLPYLLTLFALTSCSFLPVTSTAPSSSASKQESTQSSSQSESISSSSSQSTISEEESSSSTEESSIHSELQEPALSLPLGEHGDVLIEKHQYSNLAYHILVPYQGNRYLFPKPVLSYYDEPYSFVYSDSETITFTEEDDGLFIEVKYDFGGYFNMSAVDQGGATIASMRLQVETTQVGKSVLYVETLESKPIHQGDTITLAPNESISIRGRFNNKTHADIFTVEDDTVVSSSVTPYFVTLKGRSIGQSKVTASYSEADSKGVTYDYSLEFIVKVEKNSTLVSISLPGEEVYRYNGKVVYNGDFVATFSDGASAPVPEKDLSSSYQDGNATFSYSLGSITKEVTYPAKDVVGDSFAKTKLQYDYFDAWSNYGTGVDCLPASGSINFLVIPVWFTNSSSYFSEEKKGEICADIQELLFGEHEGFKTLKSYYEKESRGALSLSGTIAPWYNDIQVSTAYNDQITSDVHSLGQRAVEDYFASNLDDSISNYDHDNDGKVDGLILMYGANFYGASLSSNDSNAFASKFNDHGAGSNPKINTMCFCPIGGLYGFDGAATSAQRESEDLSKVNPDKFAEGATTLIHEVAHMIGARDLYTRTAHSAMGLSGTKCEPGGRFSMQDNNVGSHDPLQTNLFGWGNPMVFAAKNYEIGTSLDVYIDDFQSTHDSIILTPEWNEADSPFDEYLLLELFSPTGLNEYHANKNTSAYDAKGTGIRLWHADNAMQRNNNGERVNIIENGSLTFLSDNHDVGDNRFYFNRFIRNDTNDTYETSSKFRPESLFRTGDDFSMDAFQKQFLDEKGLLDSGKKLGWQFEVTSLFHNGEGKYGGTIRLTRVDDTLTEFEASLSFPGEALPAGENIDATEYFSLPEENISLKLHQNDAADSLNVIWQYPDYLLHLPFASNSNGASMEVSLLPKEGCRVSIKRIVLYYQSSTNVTPLASPTVLVDDAVITGTKLSKGADLGPSDPLYMSQKYEYLINDDQFVIQNRDSLALYITSLAIEYSIAPIQ